MSADAVPEEATHVQRPTESALRKRVARRGFRLSKSRRMISMDNHGGWMIIDGYRGWVVRGSRYECSDEDVEEFLSEVDRTEALTASAHRH